MNTKINFTEDAYVQAVHSLDAYGIFGVKEFARNNIQNTIGKNLKIVYRHIEVFDDSDDFFSFLSSAQKLIDVLNFELFKTRSVDILDDLIQVKTNCKSESLVKMLALIGMIQEFFGANVAANYFTHSDLRGVFEASDGTERSFLNIHMIHFFYQKGYMKEGLFSMYHNTDLDDAEKLEQSLEFATAIFSKLEGFLSNPMFNKLLVEFYTAVGVVKNMTNDEVSYFINNSVANGCGAINPIAVRLEELGFAEVCT